MSPPRARIKPGRASLIGGIAVGGREFCSVGGDLA